MTIMDRIEDELEKGFGKFPLHMLGAMAAALLVSASFLRTVNDDAHALFWHTFNTDAGVQHFWPQGALVALIVLFLSIFSTAIGLMGLASASAFVFRILKKRRRGK